VAKFHSPHNGTAVTVQYSPHPFDLTSTHSITKGTRLFSLELGSTNPIRPIAFSDSDYANSFCWRYCLTLGSGHKQEHAADSSCYAEYIALHDAGHEVLFFMQFLDGLDMPFVDATPARELTEDQRWHAKVKHLRVRYHTIWDLVRLYELYVSGTIWVSVLHAPREEERPDVQISTPFFSIVPSF
jgi:hypothetical protein